MLKNPNSETFAAFLAGCRHLYTTKRTVDAELAQRSNTNRELSFDFFARVASTVDFRSSLAAVTTPVLIMGGDEDPMLPPPFQDELEAALKSAPVRRVRFPDAGHFLHIDANEGYFRELRRWVVEWPVQSRQSTVHDVTCRTGDRPTHPCSQPGGEQRSPVTRRGTLV